MNSEERFKRSLEDKLASREFSVDPDNWDKARQMIDAYMNSEDKFKTSLEESLASKEFPFDADNWEKARQMIDASKRPKRAVAYFLAALLLLTGLVGTLYLISEKDAGTSSLANSAEPTTAVPATEPSTIENSNTKRHAGYPSSPAEAISSKIRSASALATDGSEPSPVPSQPDTRAPQTAQPSLPDHHAGIQSQHIPVVVTEEQQTVGVAAAPGPPITVSPEDQPAKTDRDTEKTSATAETVAGTTSAHHEHPATEQASPIVTNGTENSQASPEPIRPPATEDAQTAVATPEAASNNQQPTEISPDVKANNGEEPAKAPVAIAAQPDSSKKDALLSDLLPADNDAGQLGKPKEIPVWLSVEAGANYMLGWQNPGSRDANGFNPLFGLNYFNTFSPKTSLTFGLHYTTVNKLSYSSYTSRVTRLAMGEESQVTVFVPVKVHYLICPLRLNYNITPMNAIGIGCNVAYLLNVESDVETYNEKLNTKYDQQLSKASGYTEGFKKYDTQVSAFYKHAFYPKLAMNVEVYYGLTDIKDNTFFKSRSFERNSGVKLTLVYNFLKN